MALILLSVSVFIVHDSQAQRKIDLTKERSSVILELIVMFLLFQMGLSLVRAAVVWAILDSISGFDPSSEIIEPRHLNFVTLLTIVRQRKLKWYGHTTHSSGLAKTIMQGTVNGGRRRGRQKKRWEDNIREWTGLELRNALRKAEDREEWKNVVRRCCAAP